jgi:hypothetical protein
MRRFSLGAAVVALVTTGIAGPVMAAEPGGAAEPAEARAARAAEAFVATAPGELHAGPDDDFTRLPVQSSLGWSYVPYERTYRGVPVVGGDFVVVVDPAGRVSSTSVAQTAAVPAIDVRPVVTRAQAEKLAGGGERSTRLVVDVRGKAPRLVWETAGSDAVTVEVDAVRGGSLRATSGRLHDIGHAGLNGGTVNVPSAMINCPNQDCPGQQTWILAYPAGGGMQCNAPNLRRVDPEPLVWGNGDPTDAETACVDMMYAAGRANAMLADWLGRRGGVRGSIPNSGFPMFTDAGPEGSYYVHGGGRQPEIHIGREPNGVWDASLDIVGHESGHGLDDHTPGGVSGGGTKEFIADAFALATEWYANGRHDTPDYVLADTAALQRPAGQKRYYADPSTAGVAVNCWSSDVPDLPVHRAAGVGDHWLYLLAEGSNPTNGQPASPTCNGSTVPAIGLRAAIQILYHAMLMKNSSSSYPSYRRWTLTAARNLFPGDCGVYDTVRRAWDAVSVPQQPGELACVPSLTGLTASDAAGRLAAGNLTIGSMFRQVSPFPIGSIIDQGVAPGSYVEAGTAVNYTVSTEGVVVPDVYRDTCAEAARKLLAVGFPTVCVGDGPIVTSQSPWAWNVHPRGEAVYVTLPADRVVPRVIGQHCADAAGIVRSRDLTPVCTGSGPVVTHSEPPAGTTVRVGSTVTLTRGSAPPTPRPPRCPGDGAINCS